VPPLHISANYEHLHVDAQVPWKAPLTDYVVQDTVGEWHPIRPVQLAALDQLINETGIHALYTGMTAIGLAQAKTLPGKDGTFK